ncbi:CHAP domain-containing protein [Streptococcus dentasini]
MSDVLRKIGRWLFIGTFIGGVFVALVLAVSILGAVSGAVGSRSNCSTDDEVTETTPAADSPSISSDAASVDKFVKDHKQAYLNSWKVGGFLPSASITQTMQETSFNSSVPSFGQAHNMGGVKWSTATDYPDTLKLYGSDAVAATGSGTTVGDNTGGGYAYFKNFDAGIVGKAEFMRNQTLYSKAINNSDGKSTLDAIADGGWATAPDYKTSLETLYESVGKRYAWLDKEAIKKYGEKPVKTSKIGKGDGSSDESSDSGTESDSDSESSAKPEEDCDNSESDSDDGATDGSGTVPSDAIAWGYKPDEVPKSLKDYIHNPEDLGLKYGGPDNWVEGSGQCVDLTESLGNLIWGHTGGIKGNGMAQAQAWASQVFHNSVKTTPKAGAIFSTPVGGGGNGHTGIVCHVFENGDILLIEQNTPISGSDFYGKNDTWNYRIATKQFQTDNQYTYAYPDDKKPKWKK